METKFAIAIAIPLWIIVIGLAAYFLYLKPKGMVAVQMGTVTNVRKDLGENWDFLMALGLALVAIHFGLKFLGRSQKGIAKQPVPEKLERELRAEAEKKFPGDKERQDKYVYGALRDTGWKPRKRFGRHTKREAQNKHIDYRGEKDGYVV